MDPQLQQLVDRIQQAQNVLVTVSSNPSVDQLAAAIGLTLALNKLDKHGTAVFSGKVPSTLEFLKPEETLEKNTDSLRDFIIALDKTKADKLRYKVEDDVVRIFITPFRTSLSQKDLKFSQGDFNVDVVVALGVTEQQDLDGAITAHGRILHDATVASVSTEGQGSLGSINWVDPSASSLSEMVSQLADALDSNMLDNQIATALLTGIVANTERFSNDKTTPKTMSISAQLMAAGANQQLIATELDGQPAQPGSKPSPSSGGDKKVHSDAQQEPSKADDSSLKINHQSEDESDEHETSDAEPDADKAPSEADDRLPGIFEVKGADIDGKPTGVDDSGKPRAPLPPEPPRPSLDELLAAEAAAAPTDLPKEELTLPPLSPPPAAPLPPADNAAPGAPAPAPFQPAPTDWQPPASPLPAPNDTLTDIERSVDSPHLQTSDAPAAEPAAAPATDAASSVDAARDAVNAALSNAAATPPEPPQSPLAPPATATDASVNVPPPVTPPAVPNPGFSEPTPGNSPADEALDMPLPSNPFGPGQPSVPLTPPSTPAAPPSAFPGAPQPGFQGATPPPPPVPPPMLPPLPPQQ